jgi:mono/diheme cytochrome c family protein
MKNAIKKTALVIISALELTGCYYDNAEELYPKNTCELTTVTYAGSVHPIIQSNCISCHSAAAQQGGVNLEGFTNLKAYATNGKLSGTVQHSPGFSAMPKGAGKLSDCDIAIINEWISNGIENN